MITLDTSLTFNSNAYYIPYLNRKNSRSYYGIEYFTETYAAKGAPNAQNAQGTQNSQAAQSTDGNTQVNNNVPTDYLTLIKTLELNNPENKFAILRLLPQADIINLFSLLDKEKLLNGMQLFTKDKLLQFINHIPKENLLKLLSKIFTSKDQILEMLPIKELNHFLSSNKIDKSNLIKIFQSLSPTELSQIAEAATGVAQGNKSHTQLLQVINGLQPAQITEGIKGLEYKKMRGIVSEMLKQDPALYMEFSQGALFQETLNVPKTKLIEGMGTIDNDQLIKFLGELPENLLALVATQVDTDTLAQILVNDYQKLLGSLGA